jgi:hypothetical protein
MSSSKLFVGSVDICFLTEIYIGSSCSTTSMSDSWEHDWLVKAEDWLDEVVVYPLDIELDEGVERKIDAPCETRLAMLGWRLFVMIIWRKNGVLNTNVKSMAGTDKPAT